MTRRLRFAAPLAAALLLATPLSVLGESFVIAGAKLADGTGGALKDADVRVEGDTITAVGALKPRKGRARRGRQGARARARLHRHPQPLDRRAAFDAARRDAGLAGHHDRRRGARTGARPGRSASTSTSSGRRRRRST